MHVDDLRNLLGRPADDVWTSKGKVESPTSFVANPDPEVQRRDGYQLYTGYQYREPGAIVVVILDDTERVVCRYRAKVE